MVIIEMVIIVLLARFLNMLAIDNTRCQFECQRACRTRPATRPLRKKGFSQLKVIFRCWISYKRNYKLVYDNKLKIAAGSNK